MNVCIPFTLLVIATVHAVPRPEGGSYPESERYWTSCKPDYTSPEGVCRAGFSVTENPEADGYTKARQVNSLWDGNSNRCSDAPKRVRFFCAKYFTKAFWAGAAPICGSESQHVTYCENKGYEALMRWDSRYGDGQPCSWSGVKILCAKV